MSYAQKKKTIKQVVNLILDMSVYIRIEHLEYNIRNITFLHDIKCITSRILNFNLQESSRI